MAIPYLGDNLPYAAMGAGRRTELGTLLPPGGRVAAYVRSSGLQSQDDQRMAPMLVTTLNAGLARCRSGLGDVVCVLPGHTENISAADQMSSLVASTRIIGLGTGTDRPTFTWSAATSTFLFDVANTVLVNCILNFAGDRASTTALTVAAPITISAAGCSLIGNEINFGVDGDQLATIGLTTTAAADNLTLIGNHCWGATTSEVTTFFQIIGADRLVMVDNVFEGATSAVGVGIVRFATTASLNIRLERNTYINRKAASTAAVTGLSTVSGTSRDEHFAYLDNASLTPWITSTGLMVFHRPTVTNTAGETGTEVVGVVSA